MSNPAAAAAVLDGDGVRGFRVGRRAARALSAIGLLLLAGCQVQIAGTALPASVSAPQSASGTVPTIDASSAPANQGPSWSGNAATVGEALPAGLTAPSDGWLVLAYQAAGNDLESAILGDVHEALDTTDPAVRVLTLLDRSPSSDPDGGYSDGVSLPGIPEGDGTQLITIVAGEAQLIANLPDLPMSDPRTLAEFVAAGIQAFPTAKVALVIADHGAGWVGAAVDEVAAAADGARLLGLLDIAGGIAEGLQAAGRDKLDLIGFDACLMAQWDVALALSAMTDRLVASAENEPGAGWDWTFLADVTAADSADEFGGKIVTRYGAFYEGTRAGQDSTISLIDLTRMDALDVSLGYLSAVTVVGGTDDELAWLARARASAWEYGRSADPASDPRLVDLGSWATVLTHGGGTLADAAQQVVSGVQQAVVTQWAGPAAERATGISVYLPPSADTADPRFADIGGLSLWVQFLSDFHSRIAQLDIPADFVGLTAPEISGIGGGRLTAGARYNEGARGLVVAGSMRLGAIRADDSVAYLRSAPVGLTDDIASGSDELAFFYVSDGDVDVPVYLDQERATGIPFWYSGGGSEPIPVVIQVAAAGDGNVVAVGATAVIPGSSTASRAVLDPNGVLWPRFRTAAADGTDTGWTQAEGRGLSADLTRHVYRFGDIPSGSDIAVQIGLLLANGTEATATTLITVP